MTALIVFAKVPHPGAVKTRLARAIGDAAAAELATAFLRDTWRAVTSVAGAEPVLAVTGDGELPALTPEPLLWDQATGDLGERMERALCRGIDRSGAAIIVGTDAPTRPVAQLRQALEWLASGHPTVLGPTTDGGYHLIGAREASPGLLRGLPWSTRETFAATQSRLVERGLAPQLLPEHYDVDELDDLVRLRGDLARDAHRAPETTRALAQLDLRAAVS